MLLQSKPNESLVQKVMDEFSAATNLCSVVTDINGKEISRMRNFTPFCQKIRSNPKYHSLCQKCDMYGGLEASKIGKPLIYKCHTGLIDFSVPVIIENQLVGFLLSGQIRDEEESSEVNAIQTQLTDWKNDKDLMAAYEAIPSFPKNKVTSSAELLAIISNYYLAAKIETELSENADAFVVLKKNKEIEENSEVKKAIKYIKKNLNRPISLAEVSNHVYLSPYYFSKLFRKETNVNFVKYVNHLKLELAKEMLANPRLTIDHIAKNLGYSQTSYFCKLFRDEYQITPKAYRESQLTSSSKKKISRFDIY